MKKINCNFDIKELLFFNRLIMPQVLTVIYWIALFGVVFTGLGMMFGGWFFGGLLRIILGVIFVRIGFEMICVIFSINQNLEKLVAINSKEEQDTAKDSLVEAEAVEESKTDKE